MRRNLNYLTHINIDLKLKKDVSLVLTNIAMCEKLVSFDLLFSKKKIYVSMCLTKLLLRYTERINI